MAIKVTSALFSACVTSKDGLPDDGLPIIALVGRSNVGKSSLINTITNRKELARTSSLPGKTLTINFYNINESFYIVDLPGYGYAKASKVTRQRIQAMMNEFFGESKNLKGVIQILDARHKPSALDRQMFEWLRDQKMNYLAVITKTDKLSNQQALKMRKVILKEMGLDFALMFSSKSLSGKEDFLDALEKILSGFQFKSAAAGKPARSGDKPRSRNRRDGKDKKEQGGRSAKSGQKTEGKKADNQNKPDKSDKQETAAQPGKKEGPNSGKRRRRRSRKPSGAKNEPRSDKPKA